MIIKDLIGHLVSVNEYALLRSEVVVEIVDEDGDTYDATIEEVRYDVMRNLLVIGVSPDEPIPGAAS